MMSLARGKVSESAARLALASAMLRSLESAIQDDLVDSPVRNKVSCTLYLEMCHPQPLTAWYLSCLKWDRGKQKCPFYPLHSVTHGRPAASGLNERTIAPVSTVFTIVFVRCSLMGVLDYIVDPLWLLSFVFMFSMCYSSGLEVR